MSGLKDVLDITLPPDPSRGLLRLGRMFQPVSIQQNTSVSLDTVIEQTRGFAVIREASVTFAVQNIALFPPPLYQGRERGRVIATLAARLRAERPDVIGFTEFWMPGERALLQMFMKDIYPFSCSGPARPGVMGGASVFDSGLFLLSRHPITISHATTFQETFAEDSFASKGALHAQIAVPGLPQPYDVFLTHMQNCPSEIPDAGPWMLAAAIALALEQPEIAAVTAAVAAAGSGLSALNIGPGANCSDKLRDFQNRHLSAFVHACGSLERPSILLGDFNQNATEEDPHLGTYDNLIEQLGHPSDIWVKASGLNVDARAEGGNTIDNAAGTFKQAAPANAVRHVVGSRKDYCLTWMDGLALPIFNNAELVMWETSPSIDLSDHYGLRVTQSCLCDALIDSSTRIQSVSITPSRFICLKETTGPISTGSDKTILDPAVAIPFLPTPDDIGLPSPGDIVNLNSADVNPDEIRFDFHYASATGVTMGGARTVTGINTGDAKLFLNPPEPPAGKFGDPGDFIDVTVSLKEVDDIGADVALGPVSFRINRQMLLLLGKPLQQTLDTKKKPPDPQFPSPGFFPPQDPAPTGGREIFVPVLVGGGGEYVVTFDVRMVTANDKV